MKIGEQVEIKRYPERIRKREAIEVPNWPQRVANPSDVPAIPQKKEQDVPAK